MSIPIGSRVLAVTEAFDSITCRHTCVDTTEWASGTFVWLRLRAISINSATRSLPGTVSVSAPAPGSRRAATPRRAPTPPRPVVAYPVSYQVPIGNAQVTAKNISTSRLPA